MKSMPARSSWGPSFAMISDSWRHPTATHGFDGTSRKDASGLINGLRCALPSLWLSSNAAEVPAIPAPTTAMWLMIEPPIWLAASGSAGEFGLVLETQPSHHDRGRTEAGKRLLEQVGTDKNRQPGKSRVDPPGQRDGQEHHEARKSLHCPLERKRLSSCVVRRHCNVHCHIPPGIQRLHSAASLLY